MTTTARYCLRGHDTQIVGRRHRMCRECEYQYDRRRKGASAYRSQQRRYFIRRGSLLRINRTADRLLKEI